MNSINGIATEDRVIVDIEVNYCGALIQYKDAILPV